ncbi:Gfo/Idh/MocA family oxidoreductase [Streptomyces sp. NPDC001553]|uniref:Gfo/Idh/MocA family protein n=1 Tax=Streptomyces sp. NPDC001553 TaxID=3154385 RepID=UPI00331A1FB4
MTDAPVRIGLVGYGFGGRHFHAPLLASTPDCEFLGVVTTSPERRKQVADELNRPTYDSLGELARAGAEAVAISTPAATHIPLAQEALRLGLAVVCDKPSALDAASARETTELAERLKVSLTVYQNRRWDSDFLTLRRLVADGALGTLTASSRVSSGSSPSRAHRPRAVAPCSTSAATWSTRHSSSAGRSSGCTRRCGPATAARGSTRTSSSP